MNNYNQDLFNNIIASSGGKIDQNKINSAKKGDFSSLMSGLSSSDRQKINDALSDESKARQILSSPAAKQLLNKLFGSGR